MKTSARNQFPGTVISIVPGGAYDQIEIETAGGRRIVASVTHGSAEELGVQPGRAVVAVVNASSVVLVAASETALYPARNQFKGIIVSAEIQTVNTKVTIDVGGSALIASVANDSAARLDLEPGKPVIALFKAASVILARAL